MTESSPTPNSGNTQTRIISAAAQLFAERGFAATTTRAIAELAGVNEVTLFRRFGTKENLIQVIIEQFGGPAISAELAAQISGDYVQDLTMIGKAMIAIMTERSDAMRMAICEVGNFPEIQQIVAENPRQLRRMLALYFEDQMQAGVIRLGHPEVLAQAFLGMYFSYAVLQGFLSDTLDPEILAEDIAEQFVMIFVNGTILMEV
jgi:AcrR family transcriptional regulator